MINIEESALYNEVLAVREGGPKNVSFYWTVEIHTPTADYTSEKKLLKVMEVDIVRDYEKNLADEMTVRILIPMGLWAKRLYPARSQLEISVYKLPIGETAGHNENAITQAQRYKASPVLDGLPVLEGKDIDMIGEATLDLRDILPVTFQLIPQTVDKLRMVSVGGIFRNTTNEQVIKAVLAGESNKMVTETGQTIEAIDMVTATNTTKRDHVVLPHGLKLTDMPLYVQDKCGGVYSSGLNAYIQGRTWYVYPLYDNTRLKNAPSTVTVIKVPKTTAQGSERTYRINGKETIILATSDSSFKDDAGTQYLNEGNGVRFVDADKFLNDGLVKTLNNKAVALRGQLVNEVVTEAFKGRNHVQMSDRKITSNPYREYSQVAQRNGGVFVFDWDNADPQLLTPGMMIKILYLSGDKIETLTGVLLKTHTVVQLQGNNIQSQRHITTTKLGVFVNKTTSTS